MSKDKSNKWEEELSEYGALHNEDCCVNFEDNRACDVGTGDVDCCENMMGLAAFIRTLIAKERQKERERIVKNNNCFTCEQFKIPKVCLECRNSFRDKALKVQREEIKGAAEGMKKTTESMINGYKEREYNQALVDFIKKLDNLGK